MTTIVGSGALCTSIKGETIFFQSDLISKSNFIILEILWKKVDFPKSWHLSNVAQPIYQTIEKIEQIVQYPCGWGDLIFSSSFRHYGIHSISKYKSSRASRSSIYTRIAKMEEGSMSSKSKNIKLLRVRSHTNIANSIIKKIRSLHKDHQICHPHIPKWLIW